MAELRGVGVGTGIAAGEVRRMPDPIPEPVDRERTSEPEAEIVRAVESMEFVRSWLVARGLGASEEAKAVLDAQALMAVDPVLGKDIEQRIRAGKTAERAVFEACRSFQEMLTQLGGYLAERAPDIADVASRAIARLAGMTPPGIPQSDEPFVLVAHDLAPADTVDLDETLVLALVTQQGGPTSHTAILARSRSIPAVVGVVGADALQDGMLVIVDAGASTVTTEVTAVQVADARARRETWKSRAAGTLSPGALKDGFLVPLLANVGSLGDADEAVSLGAEGIGLLRTEFLFLDAPEAPSLEHQQARYTEILSRFPDKKVVARVLDAGSDKPLPFLSAGREPNPALGRRGLRALRENEDVLRHQLRALVNAQHSSQADLWVMAPMVSDAADAEYFVQLARESGVRVAGVMAEVPSIALLADQVMQISDFVSIGTNDLAQYTLAADRTLGTVSGLQDPWHPAVLRSVEMIAAAGAVAGKSVGVCGEAAADPELAIVLVGLGVSSLSMSARAIADVRAALLTVTREEAKERAIRALRAKSAAEARAISSR